jgi:deazaflavin-dependent oxidoreductase (nitroreductase family)
MGDGHGRSDWMRNLRADNRATVAVGRARFDATARFLERDTEEDDRARQRLVEKYRSPGDELESWKRTALAVAFDVRPSDER